MLVQTFRTEAAVECFDEETISRLAGAYEVASVRLGASFHRGSGSCLSIHPAKAVAMSDMMVAFHGDHLEKVFHTERSEGEHLDVGDAVDPDYAVFGLHADGEIMKPIDGFAQLGGDTIDGLDGMDLVQLHGQAA